MAPIAFGLSAAGPAIGRLLLGGGADATAAKGIALNIVGLAAGLPTMFLGNIRLRADQAIRHYDTTLVGGIAYLLATVVTAFGLVNNGNWNLLGFAQTAGLAAVLAVISTASRNGRPVQKDQAVLAITLVAGIVGALSGAALTSSVLPSTVLVAASVALGGWLIGFVTVTTFNVVRAHSSKS